MVGLNEFMPIKGYEGKYLISKCGDVYSLRSKKVLKPFVNEKGYSVVELWNNYNRRSAKVHRLVAETFIPNPNCRTEINHKDGNKGNNRAENLEWCTRSENLKHAYALGLRTPNKSKGKSNGRNAIHSAGSSTDIKNQC